MRKLVLLGIAVLTLTATKAQIEFGAKAGLNLANYSGSLATGAKIKVGFNVGGLVCIPVTKMIIVQPEIVYSSEGAKASNGGSDYSENLSYINVPILVKYKSDIGIFGEIGPQIGFLLSAKDKVSGTSTDVKQYFNSTNISIVFGAGYLSSMNIGADIRYNLGVANIAKDAGSDKLRTGVIQIGVFYLFGGGKG
jgi:hypothetical protein